jgi:glycolate oxidase FAD binding subunit
VTLTPTAAQDVVAAVREHARVVPHGGRTKEPLIERDPDAVRLDMTALTGVTEYEPGEFTFTAHAGTTIAEIEKLLAAHGQAMPFDPPFAEHGATIGGTLAAGLNGPGRLRYGGLRDFIIGVHFVDGTGHLIRAGGRVVKNAAGFDIPKLLVGSMGSLGVIVHVTFKVFPLPQAMLTLRVSCTDLHDAVTCTARLTGQPLELASLEIEPPATLFVRVAGDSASLRRHAERAGRAAGRPHEILAGETEAALWQAMRGFAWVEPAHWLVKVPLTLHRLPELDRALDRHGVTRRYGVAGNVAWVAWPHDRSLAGTDLAGNRGLIVRGPALEGHSPWIGEPPTGAAPFARRIKDALDPRGRLPALA